MSIMNKPEREGKIKRLKRFGWYELQEKNSVVKFCQDSGLHGLKYITGPKQHLCERLIWLLAFFIATVAGSYLVYDLWDRYYNLPVVYVASPKQLSIDLFPFPSVTVCSLNRVSKRTYEKYHMLANEGNAENNPVVQEAKENVRILDALCNPENIFLKSMYLKQDTFFGLGIQSVLLNMERSQSFQNESKIMKLLKESWQGCKNLIPEVFYGGGMKGKFSGHNIFDEVETELGICCNINALPTYQLKPWKNVTGTKYPSQWKIFTTDTKFTNNTENMRPWRQMAPGINFGLSLGLQTNMKQSYCNHSDLNRFIVSIAHPLDASSTRDKENFIELNKEVFFTLKPKITLADDSIKRFKPDERGCYFDNEWTLRDHSIYTQSNCFQECIANFTVKHCQSIANCWTRLDYRQQINWIYDQKCQVKESCEDDSISFDNLMKFVGPTQEACKQFLPTCNDFKYEYSTEEKPMKDPDEFLIEIGYRPEIVSAVNLYFDEYYTTPTILKEQFGILELLANSGRILGLCLGFSGISILEIIYYFTIRVCFRRFRRTVLLKNGLCKEDTPSCSDNANQISYLFMIQAENEETIKQLQTNMSNMQQAVSELTTNRK